MKKVILCPNPYRDSELKVAKQSREILESIGFETVVCLPFHRDGYGDELGVPVLQLQQEIKTADLLIAFLQYLPAGLWLAWSYIKGDTIFVPIAIHAAVNFITINGFR